MFAPPVEYQSLLNYCEQTNTTLPNTLQHLIIGSAPVQKPFLQRLIKYLPKHTRITCFYGMTENLMVATIDGRVKAKMECKGDLLGKPLAGIDLYIADDSEILIKSEQLFERYWHLASREEWHNTGDLGYLDTSGNLILIGRKKDMIIRRNFNLYPGLYTSTIEKINGVNEAVFIGKYNEDVSDEEVHLFIDSEPPLSEENLWHQLKNGPYAIDKEAWPDAIHFTKIPRKGRQYKVDRNQLKSTIA